ncbi:MAG: DNA polymerase III subunit chi [Sulfuritalea sp.]|nr:DNA polymerase III subunit chi [Sulfuritalea sp.]
MTQITFLHGARDRLQAVAAWLALASSKSRKILVYVPDRETSDKLDRLLWVHQASGFTPHCLGNDPLAAQTPIILASDTDNPPHDEFLLNLSDSIPPGFSRFQQVVEIVCIADESKQLGRERYRYYRERGYPLEAREFSEDI